MSGEFEERGRHRRDFQPHRGVLILILGILSLVTCGVLGIPAWLMGKKDLKAISDGQMDPEGEGLTKAGYIIGIIGSVKFVIEILAACAYVIFIVVIIGFAATTAQQQQQRMKREFEQNRQKIEQQQKDFFNKKGF